MANPGRVRRQLIGVADASKAERMVASLHAHGSTDAWVVNGGGLDELTTTGPSSVMALGPDGVRTFTVDPVEYGLPPATLEQITGGDPEFNAGVVKSVLAGEPGAERDITVLNAGAALVIAGRVNDLGAGISLAGEAIDDGRAAALLDRFVEVSQRVAAESASA
jgi:anthranilate phosphoribosyltransferase